jgi:hypothetical protein
MLEQNPTALPLRAVKQIRARKTKQKHPRSYQIDAARYKVMHKRDLGLHAIPVSRIVGSVGKPEQVDADFKPLLPGWAQRRYQSVVQAAKKGALFQPISVYKLHDLYYIVDGHNRVAAAKELGQVYIDAYVTECLPKPEGKENLLYYERKHFEEQTGLTRIILTDLWRYPRLLEVIDAYRGYISTQLGREVDRQEAARLWYRDVYQPLARQIRQSHLPKVLRGRTIGDIFFDILQYQADHSRERGRALTLDEAFAGYAAEHPPPLPQRVVHKGLEALASAQRVVQPLQRAEELETATAEIE